MSNLRIRGYDIERAQMEIQLIDKFGTDEAGKRREKMVKEAGRWLDGIETGLKAANGSRFRVLRCRHYTGYRSAGGANGRSAQPIPAAGVILHART